MKASEDCQLVPEYQWLTQLCHRSWFSGPQSSQPSVVELHVYTSSSLLSVVRCQHLTFSLLVRSQSARTCYHRIVNDQPGVRFILWRNYTGGECGITVWTRFDVEVMSQFGHQCAPCWDQPFCSACSLLPQSLIDFFEYFLAHDAFVRMNGRAILPWCSSVCLSGTGVHCDAYGAHWRGFKFMVG